MKVDSLPNGKKYTIEGTDVLIFSLACAVAALIFGGIWRLLGLV